MELVGGCFYPVTGMVLPFLEVGAVLLSKANSISLLMEENRAFVKMTN